MAVKGFFRRLLFEVRYRARRAPWDTGIPPPELRAVIEGPAALPAGRALDLGCGTGTNAVYMARHGWDVTGIDFAGAALDLARVKARAAGVARQVHFVQGDVTHLDLLPLGGPFDLALDLGCFHGLSPRGRSAYADGLGRLLRPGALYLLYAFTPRPFLAGTLGIAVDEVRALFEAAFDVLDLDTGDDPSGAESVWYRLRRR